MSDAQLINDLQTHGMRLVDPRAGQESRRGGAGPSDHKAITIGARTVMIPVHTAPSFESPFLVDPPTPQALHGLQSTARKSPQCAFPPPRNSTS